jgi:CRISPR-associated endoribonuclease Cas6
MDLLSLVITLKSKSTPDQDKSLPRWWGRAAHALLLDLVREGDPSLAERLHRDNQTRPFTVSTLMGRFSQGKLDPREPYMLRLTALTHPIATVLKAATQNGRLSLGNELELDYLPFEITALDPAPAASSPASPWAGEDSYQELGAILLLAKENAPRRLSLSFTSPTTFKSGGMHVPVPLPELVFGSLLDRWNAFAPITFPEETKRYAAECLAIGRYKLSSRAVPMKKGGLRVGGVGEISYTSLNYDRYWMSVIGTLAEFARYSGVGAGTSMGLGQCRRIR